MHTCMLSYVTLWTAALQAPLSMDFSRQEYLSGLPFPSPNWCFWNVVLGKTLESPLDCKEIKPVNPKGNQSWTFIGRTDAEAEGPVLWLPDVKSQLIRKDPDAGKDWRKEEKGTTDGEMVAWHHQLNGHEFEQALGVGEGQGSLVCCSPWGRRVGYDWATEQQQSCSLCAFPEHHLKHTSVYAPNSLFPM